MKRVMATDLESVPSEKDDHDDQEDDDDDDDDDDEHGTSTEPESSSRDEEKEIAKIIRRESKDVFLWREIVTGMMVITAALVTVTTYVFLQREELTDFTAGYTELVDTMADYSSYNMKSLVESFDGLNDLMGSFAFALNETWPFVTVPAFDRHAAHVRTITGSPALWSAPLIDEDNKAAWLNYSMQSPLPAYPEIFGIDNRTLVVEENKGVYAAVWQLSPVPTALISGIGSPINYDILSSPGTAALLPVVDDIRQAVISAILPLDLMSTAYGMEAGNRSLFSTVLQPVFSGADHRDTVGFLQAVLDWRFYFADVLDAEQQAIYAVLKNTCGQAYTWLVSGQQATLLGRGEQFPLQYLQYRRVVPVNPYPETYYDSNTSQVCLYSMDIYPSTQLRDSYRTNKPLVYTFAVGVIFFFMAFTFFAYDRFVQRRNNKVIAAAARSNAIVSSLFPSNVRDRLFAEEDDRDKKSRWLAPKSGIKSFLNEGVPGSDEDLIYQTKPIADLFPQTTIMFADLVGFTAWSSAREPSQVFTLLETVYRAFDQIAKERRVFKVETVGDCYVAVTGLPEPRKDHAVVMAKFANECMRRVHELTKKMEVALGPDTADLTIRVGMHSGPVTAGVLRGDRSRFQLFGDTMNTAARMESTGEKDKIQISQETADLLAVAGKAHWLKEREDKVVAKGKGELQTYWLTITKNASSGSSVNDSTINSSDDADGGGLEGVSNDGEENADARKLLSDRTSRLIDWNVDLLLRILKSVVARRGAVDGDDIKHQTVVPLTSNPSDTVIDEVVEIIGLPGFCSKSARAQQDGAVVEIDKEVIRQLHDYVTHIAAMYRENAFHNFEHASHVAMSVTKLLSRIVAPSDVLDSFEDDKRRSKALASTLHDHTYGITSDPLTQFACVFSALIHDVDHVGVPNTQLIKENARIAALYKHKSVAEQNSIDLAWSLLMDDSFSDLRAAIMATEDEQRRFRQLVVNSVMATDIMDKDLKALRNARWEKAFNEAHVDLNMTDSINRKATIVIEHLIQASDVSHTMQHWHIYRKWNERFFEECYQAYLDGRAECDPSENWYKGEIGFFDFYIIPLARKLKDCGVFGVSSDEYLSYATTNRKEWEFKGQEVVAEMLEKVTKKVHEKPKD